MLIVSIDELTLEDLDNYAFTIEKEKIIRFCIGINHKLICLGTEKDDHIKQGEILLNQEQETEGLTKEEIAEKMLNHIIGASIFPTNTEKVFVLIGGSSIEQALSLTIKKFHSKQAFALANDLIEKIFKKFYPNLSIKVNTK